MNYPIANYLRSRPPLDACFSRTTSGSERWRTVPTRRQTVFGLAYGHAEGASIGEYVRDLELIAKASEPIEWLNTVVYLPL